MMNRQPHSRGQWLARLSTRELVIYLMELRPAAGEQPELLAEVEQACGVLRAELAGREWPATARR